MRSLKRNSAGRLFYSPGARKRSAAWRKKQQTYVPYQPNYTIEEFCICERMSRPFYNELRDLKLIKEMEWGAWRRIPHEERLRFHERMQNLTPELAAQVQEAKARLSARGRKAAEASIASPKHISVSAATRRKAKRKQRPLKGDAAQP